MYQKILEKIKNKKSTICVVGLGYVGLPTAIFFAENGFNVIGVDVNEKKLNMINKGISPLGELGLDERLLKVVQDKKLVAKSNLTGATRKSNIILLIVPTPVTSSKDPDLSYIISAGRDIVKGLDRGKLVVLESTVYPGVTEETLQPILESQGLKAGVDFGLAYCPERYNPGDDAHSLEKVARVIGGITPEWADITHKLYQFIIDEEITVLRNIKTAEAAKVIENTQRDLNIALMNELAMIFEKIGIDVMEVIEGASTKWNFNAYYPGGGVGGHCLPVDPYYLVKKAKELGYHSKVIAAGRTINDYMPKHVFGLVTDALNDNERPVKNSKVVVLGLSYKENVGDARESPSAELIHELEHNQAQITIVDPYIQETAVSGILESDVYTALEDADAMVLMTAHHEFRDIDFEKVKNLMKIPIIIDARRIYNPEKLRKMGFYYSGVGAVNNSH
ncbi:nucleotide sugar dehydrogenase [Methanobacterium formicicum]|uniref:UDP-N-acetyl-D-mannosamine dehydrogenase n=1 Tax=Methanobacterium formicicum (strain DSM 3637 / PP1) TaxID=1204725 RepID=K2RDG3_METFP|nr:nucleotide sugar dehydrogenase [Methanobacterium formicicum]EKF86374.1 nucleotide sugar dehydrogenase [Methanobacterium formicicum DSM 3637]